MTRTMSAVAFVCIVRSAMRCDAMLLYRNTRLHARATRGVGHVTSRYSVHHVRSAPNPTRLPRDTAATGSAMPPPPGPSPVPCPTYPIAAMMRDPNPVV